MADDKNRNATQPSNQTWMNPDTSRRWNQAAQVAADNARAVMAASAEAYGSLEQRQQSIEDFVAGVVRTNLQASKELLRLTSPIAFIEVQQRFARQCLHAFKEAAEAFRGVPAEEPPPVEQPGSPAHRLAGRQAQRVADVMARNVRLISPEATVQQAAQTMRGENAGALPVGEVGGIVGIITDHDIAARVVAEGRDPALTRVREIMTPEVRHLFVDEDLRHAADTMVAQQVSRLPVMNREERLVGMVSLADLVAVGGTEQPAAIAPAGIAGRILLVDDETDVLYSVGQFLEKAGFQVATATSGDKALALMAGGTRYDALLTDFAMPGFSGGELVTLAREMQPGLPAIVMTGFAEVDTGLIAQTAAVLRKPFQRQQLIATVREVIAAGAGVAATGVVAAK